MKITLAVLSMMIAPVLHAGEPLIVVQDLGGVSALPYYEVLNLQQRTNAPPPNTPIPPAPATPVSEADMLPVRSSKLTPGTVERRTIEAPGLRPFFIIGDDKISADWLRRHAASLRERGAVGLVVNVETIQALNHLRTLVPDVLLSPVPADDLAERLRLIHYPALITTTGIEQ